MSTLKTNNIEHLDASTPSIQTTIGGGTILAGVTTVSDALKVGTGITFNTEGSCSLANDKFTINTQGSFFINTDRIIGAQDGQLTVKRDVAGSFFYGGTTADPQRIVLNSDGSASFASSGSVAAVTGKVSTNNGGYNCFRGVNSSNAEVFYVSHNGRVGATGGIIFGSDTAAANVLDDYEEGAHVPALAATTGTLGSITYSTDTGGKYIKIGSIVHFWGTVRWSAYNVGSGSGSIQVTMPFTNVARTSGDDADNAGAAFAPVWGGTSNKVPTTVFGIQNQSKLGFRAGSNDSIAGSVQVSQVGTTGMVNFSITYQTSS